MKTTIQWDWEDAFSKFGFGDGDGPNFTDKVRDAIESKFDVMCNCWSWGLHNYIIMEMKRKDGSSVIPDGTEVGYDDPRKYLPPEMVKFLDETFKD